MEERYKYLFVPAHLIALLYYVENRGNESAKFLDMWDVQFLATIVDGYYFTEQDYIAMNAMPTFCAGPGSAKTVKNAKTGEQILSGLPVQFDSLYDYIDSFGPTNLLDDKALDDLNGYLTTPEYDNRKKAINVKKILDGKCIEAFDRTVKRSVSQKGAVVREYLKHIKLKGVSRTIGRSMQENSLMAFYAYIRKLFVPNERTQTLTINELKNYMETYFSSLAPYCAGGLEGVTTDNSVNYNYPLKGYEGKKINFNFNRFYDAFKKALQEFNRTEITAINNSFYEDDLQYEIPEYFETKGTIFEQE